ncbi:MAG TPA: DNA-directed RNA polymerase subunit omega [Candidatus Thalassarchaeaceae archaeon]|nr:DNA-directed RNA polymerase subunit omega [Candidatus Thalassarchaeaceae archaeon]
MTVRMFLRSVIDLIWMTWVAGSMVEPARPHTRFEKARIIGARALQISMGAPLFVSEEELREEFSGELTQLYGVDEAKEKVVLDPMKIATLEYERNRIPIDIDPHLG